MAEIRSANTTSFSNRVRPLLPPDTDLMSASAGFRNETDFLAALHASRSLGIPFSDVKGKMTEGGGRSLDKAIQSLRPELEKDKVKQSAKDAEQKARDDIRAASGNPNRMNAPREVEVGVAGTIRMNRGLNERVLTLLPPSMSLEQASAGFQNTGQFLSALHVSRNLGIPFPELRARMIAGGESLGEAIRMLRPSMTNVDVEASAQFALKAAEHDSTGQPQGSSPTGTPEQNR